IAQDVISPETQHAIAFRRQVSIAHLIAFAFGVLPAVDLDDDLVIAANEVHHIGPNRLLTNEFETGQSAVAHGKPKFGFRISRICPQLADSSGGLTIPSPHPWALTRLPPSLA